MTRFGQELDTHLDRCFLANLATAALPVYPFEGFSVELDFGAGQAVNGELLTLGSIVYKFVTAVPASDDPYDVEIGDGLGGGDASDTIANLISAITAGAGEGTTYGTGTVAHPDGYASPSWALNTDSAHFTSLTKLTIAEAVTAFALKDVNSNIVTEMVQYPSGDWARTAAHSAALNLVNCRVHGFTPRQQTAGTRQGLTLTNHAALLALKVEMDFEVGSANRGSSMFGLTPLHVLTGAGLAAYWETTGCEGYIHWSGDSKGNVGE